MITRCGADELGDYVGPIPWIIDPETIKEFEDIWARSNRSILPYIQYHSDQPAPVRIQAPTVPLWSEPVGEDV